MKRFTLFLVAILLTASTEAGVNRWTTQGPHGGSISALEVDPRDPSVLFAVAFGHGVFRSRDGGQSWADVSEGLGVRTNASDVLIDAHNEGRVFATTVFGGVFQSDDSGESWRAINEGLEILDQLLTFDLEMDVDPDHTLYLTTRGGLFRRPDGAASWEKVETLPLSSVGVLEIDDSTSPSTLFASGRGADELERLYRSDDGGITWNLVNESFGLERISDLAVDPSSPMGLWATTSLGLSRSEDLGSSWQRLGAVRTSFGKVVILATEEPTIFVTSASGVWRSVDGGLNWNLSDSDFFGRHVISISASRSDSSVLFAGTFIGGGVFRSDDLGQSWRPVNAGINATTAVTLVHDPVDARTLYAVTSENGIHKTIDGGSSWRSLNQGLPSPSVSDVVIDPKDPQRLFAGLEDGIYGSVDSGETWRLVFSAPGLFKHWALAIDSEKPSIYAASSAGEVFISIDRGESWEARTFGITGQPRFEEITIDPTDAATIYLAYAVQNSGGGGVFRSTDGGESWHTIGDGLPNERIASLAADPSTPGRLLAATWGEGIYRSDDGGESWRQAFLVSAGLVAQIRFAPSDPSVVYAAARGAGMLRSTDGGESWEFYSRDLDDVGFACLAVDPAEPSTVYAGSEFHGIYELRQAAGQRTLWLQGGRFQVDVSWRDFEDNTGEGHVAWLDSVDQDDQSLAMRTEASTVLQFAGPENWESLLKVLDGRGFNGHHWLFFAAATNVGYRLTVSDLQCDREVVIANEVGQPATPIADTMAFPSCEGTPAVCVEGSGTACLGGGRFRATMTWTDFAGETRDVNQAELAVAGLAKSSESGVFSFFDEENWELLVKVLDGCAFNDRFWVFSTGTTNVEYDLRVTDTATGAVWASHNPLGRIAPAATDTEAFATCPD